MARHQLDLLERNLHRHITFAFKQFTDAESVFKFDMGDLTCLDEIFANEAKFLQNYQYGNDPKFD